MITGINIVRNCIENGYPFAESILSVYPICGEYLVNDGGSTDGTLQALEELREVYPRIRIHRIHDKPSVRWDSVSDQINQMIKQAKGDVVFLGNADELIHEEDLPKVENYASSMGVDVLRFRRRETRRNWSGITEEYYEPARLARNYADVHQDWNQYGGDEFLFSHGWVDPHRENTLPITLYHLFNMFPENRLSKLRNDAEYLAPGDGARVAAYERQRRAAIEPYATPTSIYPNLPALAKGLPYMSKYRVRECLYNVDWVERVTGLSYSTS